jgi:hypothetical protein
MHATTWINIEDIRVNEISQSQKAKIYDYIYIYIYDSTYMW